nr:phage holin [Enterococcus sp. 665A]
MDNKTYEILKTIGMIVLPALATFIGTVGKAFNWVYTDITVIVITALATFIGTILGVSSHNYNKLSDQEWK